MATRKVSKKMDFRKNIEIASSKNEVTKDLWGLLAGLTWLLPASYLKLDGWGGFAVASAGTWLTGALFDIEAMRRSALAVGAVHLLYTKGSKAIQDNLKVDLWRMGTTDSYADFMAKTAPVVNGLRGLSNAPVQPGSSIVRSSDYNSAPNGLVRRPAESLLTERALPPIPSKNVAGNTDTMMGLSGYKTVEGEQTVEVSLLPQKGLISQPMVSGSTKVNMLPDRNAA